MAILGKIRSQGLILILVIALALFAFIIQGALDSSGASKESSLGTIGDVNIDRTEFAKKVEAQQGRSRGSVLQTVNSLWDQEVRKVVLDNQMEKAGIEVSDEEIRQLINTQNATNPDFLDENGEFSEIKMNTYYANAPQEVKAMWNTYIENVAVQAKQQKLFNLIKSGVIGTEADGEMEYRLENDTRNFTYVNIPYTTIADSLVDVSKSEISSYISKHESEFKSEAQRDIQFVVFEDKASTDDENELKDDLRKLLTSRKEFNNSTKQTDTIPGLRNIDSEKLENFINANSDLPYSDAYVPLTKLPEDLRGIATHGNGAIAGPYKDGEYMKISRVTGKKTVMDSVQNKHILFAYAGAQRATATRTKEEAKKLADSVFSIIGQSGSKYATQWDYFNKNTEIAKAEDLGWMMNSGNGQNLAKGYKDFLYSNDKGTIGIAESSFGYHIIRIEDTKASTETLQLATLAKKVTPSKTTGKKLFANTQKFEQALVVNKKDFVEVAKEYNLNVNPVNDLKELDETLPGLDKNRSIVRWAFEENTEVGDAKSFQTSQGFVIAQITRKADEGLMPVEEVSATVAPILRNKKKAAMILGKITNPDLNEIASAQGQSARAANAVSRKNPTLPGVGEEPAVVGTAFGLENGQTSKPIIGEKGVFVVKVTAIENAPDLANYRADANEVAQRTANQSTSQLVNALKKSIEIEDNRSVAY